MMYLLSINSTPLKQHISIKGSKSESNRLLVLQKLLGGFTITNLSDSVDTQVLQKAWNSEEEVVDIGHAGTAMRFLTAYFAIQEGKTIVLKGSQRMHERPIAALVEALQSIGAEIDYLENTGYPPLKIKGKKLLATSVTIDASMSSQFVTALLLIAPSFPKGLQIQLLGEITSLPYIKMTLDLLKRLGVSSSMNERSIQVSAASTSSTKSIEVESDWSSASYLYSFFALSEMQEMRLGGLRQDSLQGDSVLQDLFIDFGVRSHWDATDLVLEKTKLIKENVYLNCADFPDVAQTLAVTAFALGMSLHLTGLHTLKIKETDRLIALQNELQKLGAKVQITAASLKLEKRNLDIKKEVQIETYQDHRMAMAFTPLVLKVPIQIQDPEVVNKSFPDFWKVMQRLGVLIQS